MIDMGFRPTEDIYDQSSKIQRPAISPVWITLFLLTFIFLVPVTKLFFSYLSYIIFDYKLFTLNLYQSILVVLFLSFASTLLFIGRDISRRIEFALAQILFSLAGGVMSVGLSPDFTSASVAAFASLSSIADGLRTLRECRPPLSK